MILNQAIIKIQDFTISLENLNYLFVVISSLFVIIGVVFAVFQFYKEKRISKVSKAIEIAKMFESEMDTISFILIMFSENFEMKKIILNKKDKIERALNFDEAEMKRIFSSKEISEYNIFIRAKDDELLKLMLKIANKFEYLSMNFNTGIADDYAVYQSLHQAILILFPYLYMYICMTNVEEVDQYYTHFCDLYIRWNKIRDKALKRVRKSGKWLSIIQRIAEKRDKNSARTKSTKV